MEHLFHVLDKLEARQESYEKERSSLFERERVIQLKISSLEPYSASTSRFKDYVSAYSYYSKYGNDHREVERKIEDGEICIGLISGAGYWNDENRWVSEEHPNRKKLNDEYSRLVHLRHGLDVKIDYLRDLRFLLARILIGSKCWISQESKHKTALKIAISEVHAGEWQAKLPYCHFGRPCYTHSDYLAEYVKPENTRVAIFTWKGQKWIAVRFRMISGPEGPIWGMQDTKHRLMVIQGNKYLEVNSVTEMNRTFHDQSHMATFSEWL